MLMDSNTKDAKMSDTGKCLLPKQSNDQRAILTYGWGNFRPGCLKFLTSSRWFLVVSMVYTLGAGISMNGLPVLILPSIEKRFSLPSIELGIIAAANDIAALLFVVFISFYGDYGNRIKWVGGGAATAGCGLLLFILPHYIIGPYTPSGFQPGSDDGMCQSSNSSSLSGSCDSNNSGGMWYYMVIFVIAQFIHGAGICPLYSLVPAYLDDNVEPKQLPIYLGLWYLSAFLGPGTGIFIAGQFLSVFVDINQPSGLNLTPKDSRWIGAWWIGYLIFGLLFFLLAIIISGFPNSLPGAKERREKHIKEGTLRQSSGAKEARLKEILPELKYLFVNWTFLFNSLGLSFAVLFIGSLVPFLGKLLQLKFSLDPVSNGNLLSAMMIPTIMLGVLVGAFITRQFSVKGACKSSALIVAVTQIVNINAPFAILIPGCLNADIAGVSTAYNSLNFTQDQHFFKYSKENILVSQCNLNCSCSIDRFTPVCGSDNIVYANPCYAGCTQSHDNQTFSSCSCIVAGKDKPGTAKHGYCDRHCENMAVFLLMIGFAMFVNFVAIVPAQTVILRCVPDNKRSFAIGIQYVLLKTVGLIPGPILFGHLVDLCCRLWQDLCGQKGRCFDYNADLVGRNVCIFGAFSMGISAVCYVFSWLLCKPAEKQNATVVKAITNDDETENFETVL